MKWSLKGKLSVLIFTLLFGVTLRAQEPAHKNVKYGPHERNIFDLWLPKKSLFKNPLVIFIHGGGFVSGDKESLQKYPGTIEKLNKLGIAVAAINYRFLEHASLQDIMKEDIGGFVQFIRYNAKTYNIQKKYVMAMGSSAGGSASLWLGTHDDIAEPDHEDPIKRESSRIIAFAHINAQAGYDFIHWYDYFGKALTDKFMKDQIWSRYHLTQFDDLLTTEGKAIRADLDSVNNMDAEDATMYIFNSYELKTEDNYDYDYFIHGPHHAKVLIERAKSVGLKNVSYVKSNGDKLPNVMENVVNFFHSEIMKKKMRGLSW
jgi:carboxylesterase type B